MIGDIKRADGERRTAQSVGKVSLELGRGKLACGVETRQNLCRLRAEHRQQLTFEREIASSLSRELNQIERRCWMGCQFV